MWRDWDFGMTSAKVLSSNKVWNNKLEIYRMIDAVNKSEIMWMSMSS